MRSGSGDGVVIEETSRRMALGQAVGPAARHESNQTLVAGSMSVVLERRWSPFKRGLKCDTPVKVKPLRVALKPAERAVKGRPCIYSVVQAVW